MNYLSHYFLDKELDHPEFLLGSVLPDLFRAGNRKLRIPEIAPETHTHPKLVAFQRGVNKHHLVDRLFHNAIYFHSNSRKITNLLRKADLEGMTRFHHFYGHILLEILIDQILLEEEPDLGLRFYDLLDKVDTDALFEYLKALKLDEHFDSFMRHYEGFKSYRFLLRYAEPQGSARTIVAIAKKMHGYDLTESDVIKLDAVVEQGLDLLRPQNEKLFHTIALLCDRDEINTL